MCWEDEHKLEIADLKKQIQDEKEIRRIKREKYRRRVGIIKDELKEQTRLATHYKKDFIELNEIRRQLFDLLNGFYPKTTPGRYKVENFESAFFKIKELMTLIQYLER